MFNVLARWKPFNFGLIFDEEFKLVTRRIGLSLLILTILPILYFLIILYFLECHGKLCEQQRKYLIEFIAMVLSGIIPSFGIFGFYRLWLGIIEYKPTSFYVYNDKLPWRYKQYRGAKYNPEPSLEELGILISCNFTWSKNLVVGLIYIVLSSIGSMLPYTIILITSLIIAILILYSKTVLSG